MQGGRKATSRHGSGGAQLDGLGPCLHRHKAGPRQVLGAAADGAALPHRLPASSRRAQAADRMVVASAGLALIGLTVGEDLKPIALALALAGALSWAIGNVLVKRNAEVPIFPLVVWCSVVPPRLLSAVEDRQSLVAAMVHVSWLSIAAAIYLATLTTIFGYAVRGPLLQTHSASVVAPFALLSPCAAILASAALFGEAV